MADLSSYAAVELVAAIREDNATLQKQLAAERARADRMAAFLRSDQGYDPTDVLGEHDAARAEEAAGG